MSIATVYFRAGIGAVITNDRGQVLACERTAIPGFWQTPQGGIEEGEEPLDTAWREIHEETGIRRKHLELLRACAEPLAYELPLEFRKRKTGRGQVLYWFLFRLKAGDEVIDLSRDDEFRAWKWMTFDELIAAAADFRRPLYRRVKACFADAL